MPPITPCGPVPAGFTYALRLSYDGAPFMGWQLQPHGPSIQGKLEESLGLALHCPKHFVLRVHGSGRTDSGVHASNQIAHFCFHQPLNTQALQQSLNGLCNPFIVVKQLLTAPAHFHARHSVQNKCYRYWVFNQAYPPCPFVRPRCWWIRRPLNLAVIQRAAALLVGEHDFSAFRSQGCKAKSPVRHLQALRIIAAPQVPGVLWFEFEGRGFLQHMVRIIVGSLIEIGQEKRSLSTVQQALTSGDRNHAGITAPAQGLHLERVFYNPKIFPTLFPLWQDGF